MRANAEQMRAARLAANMSRADLAVALRRVTSGRLKASERGIRGWEKGEYRPSDGVIPAYALATGKPLEFFYSEDEAEDDPVTREQKLMNLGLAVEALVR